MIHSFLTNGDELFRATNQFIHNARGILPQRVIFFLMWVDTNTLIHFFPQFMYLFDDSFQDIFNLFKMFVVLVTTIKLLFEIGYGLGEGMNLSIFRLELPIALGLEGGELVGRLVEKSG